MDRPGGGAPVSLMWLVRQGHPGELTAMAAHPFLPFVASADDTRAVRLLDTEERMHVRTLRPFDSNVSCMTFTPSGNQLAFALCSGRVGATHRCTWGRV